MQGSDLWEMGNKWGEPCDCPSYCLERVSRIWCIMGGAEQENPAETWQIPWVEERKLRARVHRPAYRKEESYKERKPQRSAKGTAWVFSGVLINACMWCNYLRAGRKTTWTDDREQYFTFILGLDLGLFPDRLENLTIREHWIESSKRSCLSNMEQITTD